MNKPISIKIPVPCHENWNTMTPAEKGRFCHSCEKIVIDFTKMSDHQIVDFFNDMAKRENTCGRFRHEQLNTSLLPAPLPEKTPILYRWFEPLRKIAAMLITGISLLLTSCTDNRSAKGQIKTTATIDSPFVKAADTDTTQKDVNPKTSERHIIPELLLGDVCIDPEPDPGIAGGVRVLPEDDTTLTGDTVVEPQVIGKALIKK